LGNGEEMKRLLLVLALCLSLLIPTLSFAAATAVVGTVEKASVNNRFQRVRIPITFTAHTDATTTTATINPSTTAGISIKGWYLYSIETDPGSPGPTNGAWDLDVTDAKGYVVTRNLVDDRSSSATQTVVFNTGYPMILDNWTVSIGDNAVNSAIVVVYLTFVEN
jgi:hypothetical protein